MPSSTMQADLFLKARTLPLHQPRPSAPHLGHHHNAAEISSSPQSHVALNSHAAMKACAGVTPGCDCSTSTSSISRIPRPPGAMRITKPLTVDSVTPASHTGNPVAGSEAAPNARNTQPRLIANTHQPTDSTTNPFSSVPVEMPAAGATASAFGSI